MLAQWLSGVWQCGKLLTRKHASRTLRGVLSAWQQRVEIGAVSKQRKLKAWYFFCFITLTKVSDAAHTHALVRTYSQPQMCPSQADMHARL